MNFYRSLVRPVLFRFDAERIHRASLAAARAAGRNGLVRDLLTAHYAFDDPRLRISVAGIGFPNPVGLPGGYDKNGEAVEGIATAGFGFIEVGSVSLHASAGNTARPRLFRLPEDESLMVYYGVPNDGAAAVAARLATARVPVPVAINVVETNTGKMAETDEAIEEMAESVRPFLGIAQFIVLNLNCPNSMGGMSPFEDLGKLARLLEAYRRYESLPPVFLKVKMAVDEQGVDAVLRVADPFSFIRGFIPKAPEVRPYRGIRTPPSFVDRLPGSLAGPSTRRTQTALTRAWYCRIDHSRHALIGAGGICSAEDAYERIRAGASLVKLYTALVYHGPGLVKEIKQGLVRLLERDGFRTIPEAVGADCR